jgi:hypothetical protein
MQVRTVGKSYAANVMSRIFVFEGRPFMRVTPAKHLFHSTTVHEVVNRGDFFAVNLATGVLTILKGGSDKM